MIIQMHVVIRKAACLVKRSTNNRAKTELLTASAVFQLDFYIERVSGKPQNPLSPQAGRRCRPTTNLGYPKFKDFVPNFNGTNPGLDSTQI
jgi:hypothetical protein